MWIVVKTEIGTGRVLEEKFRSEDQIDAEKYLNDDTDFIGYLTSDDIDLPKNTSEWLVGHFKDIQDGQE